MGFKEGQLFLDSPNGTYYSGQSIQGKLIFQEEKVKSFRGLYVKITGFCHVHWTTSRTRTTNGKSETYTVNHDSHEEYINVKVYMLGGEAGEYTIQPGKYEFPFHFRLPDNCPSSFEGPYGHIRYEIKAVVDRAFKFNLEKKVMARVMAPLDLNLDPYCRTPIEMELLKSYYCCCVNLGSSNVTVKLPIGGYCPGQTIPIKLSCSNKGRVEIKDIKLSIIKKVTYIATCEPGKEEEQDKVVEIRKGPVAAKTTRNWTVDMVVPIVDVYNLFTCQYIRAEYTFKVHVSPKGCHTNVGSSRRIVIGTIPLTGFQDNQPPVFHPIPEGNLSGVNTSYPTEPHRENPPPYPGNSDNPQNLPYDTKSKATPRPDNAYVAATAPALDSPDITLPEK
ncbi:arrestin domain-containing protein 4-like [Maniola jurtina]|uniref:arrestin domain-containing protein 4-like n=1 Tax=Maniola jurtina TaxID=191418 RepID=UPI001E68777A|nr:arrestin domain-containing protein 4-like [Maniola jurtina]